MNYRQRCIICVTPYPYTNEGILQCIWTEKRLVRNHSYVINSNGFVCIVTPKST